MVTAKSKALVEIRLSDYTKVMSISDEMMFKYYELLTDADLDEVKKGHPMEAKKDLAREIVQQYEAEVKRQAVTVDDFDPT